MEDVLSTTGSKIGTIIANLREEKGYTQQLFAKKVGISQPTLSAIESGRQLPKIDLLLSICANLDLDPLAFTLRLLNQSLYLDDVKDDNLKETDYKKLSKMVKDGMLQISQETKEEKRQRQLDKMQVNHSES